MNSTSSSDHLIVPAVVQPGRAGAFVVRHLLSYFELPSVAKVFGDTSGPEGVASDFGGYQACSRATADQPHRRGDVNRIEQACLPLEEVSASKRKIACTRSFGSPDTELVDLVEAVSEFAGRALLRNYVSTTAPQGRSWSSSTPRPSGRRTSSTRARSRCRCGA